MALLDPKTDFAFRKLFANDTPRGRRILRSLVNAFLSAENGKITLIEEIKAVNPFDMADFKEDKESILDIKAIDENGIRYNIEMQCSADPEYFKRALFYWAKIYSGQLAKGGKYSQLVKTIGIHFLNFDCMDSLSVEYHNTFRIANSKNPKLVPYGIDMLEIHLIELAKFARSGTTILTSAEEWAKFFTDTEECLKNESSLKTQEVKEALDDLDHLNLSGKEREYYEASVRRMSLENTLVHQAEIRGKLKGIAEGMEKGIAEGMEKGKLEGIAEGMEKGIEGEKRKLAKLMKEDGMQAKKIAQLTGLAEEEINEI